MDEGVFMCYDYLQMTIEENPCGRLKNPVGLQFAALHSKAMFPFEFKLRDQHA